MRQNRAVGILLLLLLISSCSSEKNSDKLRSDVSGNGTKGEIVFEKPEHDLGTVSQGEMVGYNFTFTNTGDGVLLILDASASCGCTVPRFSKEPVHPGEKGKVEVMFDTTGRIGEQSKTVTIRTSGKEAVVYLTIKANIVKLNS